jgi:LuxR family maltose regulon positive regulatory protein
MLANLVNARIITMIGQPNNSARALTMQWQRLPQRTSSTQNEDVIPHNAADALAKLARPRLYNAVPRERLFSVLDERRAHPLVWVFGPPGAGKTTLVASYLDSRQLSAVWYHMDSGDADPGTFFHYLARACAPISDGIPTSLPKLTPAHDLPSLSRAFFRELFSRLPRPAVLVLDDYQELFEDSAFHMRIADAAQEIPEGISVVIASCSEPPSAYARLAANKTMSCVDWAELRLTPEETRRIACATQPMDESVVGSLHRQCDGWVAGLTLMLARIRRAGIPPRHAEAESRAAVFDYFAGQILDKTPPDHQHILLTSAFLPRMTAASAEAISGSSHAGRVLNDMHRRQLFICRVPGSPPSYQYFGMLREFLLTRAQESYTHSELHALACRAARILQADGEVVEAITLYQRTQDCEAAIALLLREARTLLAQGRGQALREGIAALPGEHIADNPWLSYWRGASLIQVDQPAARRALEHAFEELKTAEDALGQMFAVSGIIETCRFEWSEFNLLDSCIDILEQLLAHNCFPSSQDQLQVYAAMLTALVARKPDHPLLPVCVRR